MTSSVTQYKLMLHTLTLAVSTPASANMNTVYLLSFFFKHGRAEV